MRDGSVRVRAAASREADMPKSRRFGTKIARVAVVGALVSVLGGCQAVPTEGVLQPVYTPVTKQSHSLRTIPAPSKRITVAVYDFPDLTGQYKERENVQTLSRAVTQGGAPMLIKALQDAGEKRWFTVLDRARLDDLLKERQIVTEMRRLYRNEQRIDARILPPLDHAGIILQGGITGYDTNTMTGGIGARYLGIGGDVKWQQDTVTVTLRAVSTNTGEVLSSVAVHKMIASYALQGGAFRYVALDKILEAEAGVTQNEPKQIAVQQAIEKAVMGMIIEGAELGVWSFEDRDAGRELIADYRNEKYGTKLTAAAEIVPPPKTRNAADVVETTAAWPRAAAAPRRTTPALAAPPPGAPVPVAPPPAAPDETVGSLEPGVAVPEASPAVAGAATAPNPAATPKAARQRDYVASIAPVR
ncbi:curlin [Mesorhizobium sp. B2-4-9]|nr:curlin [Mesorhizobium sp. B2-5-2]TPL17147.1 curlin [Mesorhizobium sp. B2-4-7]TPL28958.1 curlin [Mesorhizobium sp. B2-4-9]TPL33442.1 curlin [Mesorhizobium sp. B2-4-5]TPM69118.1 curlin [Mesorhizobium sp. B2-1-6]TPN73603.1 curlin [Mesorhizobium sp. B1-1-2]